jgi:hypothetical protein
MFFETFISKAHSRQFFALANGQIGAGPKLAQPGDVVVVFQNGACPHVVRQNGAVYRCMGLAYVPNLMAGEVVQMDVLIQTLEIA